MGPPPFLGVRLSVSGVHNPGLALSFFPALLWTLFAKNARVGMDDGQGIALRGRRYG
jgi:hypothetical protein